MEKQQTAVEWLIEQIERKNGKEFASFYSEFIQQAKQMEKGLIEYSKQKGYTSGWLDGLKQGIDEGNNKKEIKSKIQ